MASYTFSVKLTLPEHVPAEKVAKHIEDSIKAWTGQFRLYQPTEEEKHHWPFRDMPNPSVWVV